jgi:N-acetylmuramoyl-L-alanine amidase
VLAGKLRLNQVKTDSQTLVGSRQGALTGSVFAQVPTVVIEMIYLSNPSDAEFIRSDENRDLVAKGILEGIRNFVIPGY